MATLDVHNISEVVHAWANRTTELQKLPDGECVVIFENFGAEIGATISHPHGQIYAFDHVPHRIATQLTNRWIPDEDPGDRLVFTMHGWKLWAEYAPVYPVSLRLAPVNRVAQLSSLSDNERTDLADVLKHTFTAFAQLFDDPAPYMLWWNQAPRTASDWPDAWLNMELISPWRANKLPRYIAGVEVATGEYFNPVDPADIAARLRNILAS